MARKGHRMRVERVRGVFACHGIYRHSRRSRGDLEAPVGTRR